MILRLSNNSMELIRQCPRASYYGVVLRKRAALRRSALDFGSAIHDGLAALYSGASVEEAVKVMPAFESDDYRNYDTAKMVLQLYKPKQEWLPPDQVETKFACHLTTINDIDVVYRGRFDLVKNGWIIDHKTTSMLGETFNLGMEVSPQLWGYVWAYERLFGVPAKGFIVNTLCIRPSIANAMVVGDELIANGSSKPFEVGQLQFEYSQQYVDDWLYSTVEFVSRFITNLMRNEYTLNRQACVSRYGLCPYWIVCQAKSERERAMLINSNSFVEADETD